MPSMDVCMGSSRKRSSSCSDEEGLGSAPMAKQRPCCSPGGLESEALAWLDRHGMMGLLRAPMGPLPPQSWLALAELNMALAAFQHTFAEIRLLEHHTFTRCPRAMAFEKLAFARGCHDIYTLQQRPHLQAVSLVLETALQSCSDAAISQATLLCPPFLAAWAARWLPASSSGGPPPRLRLTILQGYRQDAGPLRVQTVYNLGLPTICSTPAAATVYIPCTD